MFDTIAQSAAQLCEAQFCHVFRSDGELLHFVAHHGLTPEGHDAVRHAWPMAPNRGSAAGRSVLDRGVAHIPDVHTDPDYVLVAIAEVATFRSTVGVPMLRDGVPTGAITVSRSQVGPFPDRQIDLLKTFADQAVIAIENVRLFQELQDKNQAITEAHAQVTVALEQQTATGEILRVISSSPTDVQPVFDAIVASAVRLCDASFGGVLRFDGESLHIAAVHNLEPARLAMFHRLFPMRPTPDVTIGRAILERAVVHIEDVLRETSNPTREAARGSRLPGVSVRAHAARRDAARRHLLLAARAHGPSPRSRSRSSVPLPTRRSSRSRTSASSKSLRPGTATSPRRWSSRPRRARFYG